MLKFKKIQQKARIVLNSQDAVKTIEDQIIPITEEPVYFDPSVANVIDTINNQIIFNNHWFLNDPVLYTTTGTAIGGLTANNQYYTQSINDNIFELSQTPNGPSIDLTNVGSGEHTLTFSYTFDGSSSDIVKIENNTFTTQQQH
jgi:hypothetical protein